MSESPMSLRRGRRQARVMRVANVPIRRLLSLPFATPLSGRLMLLTLTGRKTGRTYRQPVSYVVDGENLLTPGGGKWKLNLREGEPITIRLRGHDVVARPELVRDPDEVERLLHRMVAANPRLASFVPFIGGDRRIDRGRPETAVRYGFAVVRWYLDRTERAAA